MGVGALKAVTIDVNDLKVAEHFWSEVLGLPVLFHAFLGQYSGLGHGPGHDVLLQLVPEQKTSTKNRVHLDVAVAQLSGAILAVEQLDGRLVRETDRLFSSDDRTIEFAVMADPFDNEFCLIQDPRSGRAGRD